MLQASLPSLSDWILQKAKLLKERKQKQGKKEAQVLNFHEQETNFSLIYGREEKAQVLNTAKPLTY